MILGQQQTMIRDMARDFSRREIAPHAGDWDRRAHVPVELLERMGALGLMGVCVPEAWGGAGADFVSCVLATEEFAAGDGGLCNAMNVDNPRWSCSQNGALPVYRTAVGV